MDQNACMGNPVDRITQLKLRPANFHSRSLRAIEDRVGFINLRQEPINFRAHLTRNDKSFVTLFVTGDANRLFSSAQKLVGGRSDLMIIMALNTFAKTQIIKSDFMRTRLEQLSLPCMTLATDIGY